MKLHMHLRRLIGTAKLAMPFRELSTPKETPMKTLKGTRLGLALALTFCAGGAALAADEVVIGASIPLSGALAGFGNYQKWGYETAVNDLNKAGGITVDGKKTKVRLVIRDDKTDPNVTAGNTETLISRDKVTAMLGSCTPALVNAGALVAERRANAGRSMAGGSSGA